MARRLLHVWRERRGGRAARRAARLLGARLLRCMVGSGLKAGGRPVPAAHTGIASEVRGNISKPLAAAAPLASMRPSPRRIVIFRALRGDQCVVPSSVHGDRTACSNLLTAMNRIYTVSESADGMVLNLQCVPICRRIFRVYSVLESTDVIFRIYSVSESTDGKLNLLTYSFCAAAGVSRVAANRCASRK